MKLSVLTAKQSEQFCAIKSQRDQLAEALRNISKGQYPKHDFETFGDEADIFAGTELLRIMGEK